MSQGNNLNMLTEEKEKQDTTEYGVIPILFS